MRSWLRPVLLALVVAAPAAAQDASPPRGNWFGDHVPNAECRMPNVEGG